MECGKMHGELLLKFACNTLVFTREFLQTCSKELEFVVPEHVICENPKGIFKDFGNGFYAYRKQYEDEQTLLLNCTLGESVFRVYCPINSKAISVPQRLDLPCSEVEDLTWRGQVKCFSGYTILSDGTVMIPLDCLYLSAFGQRSDKIKSTFFGVDSIEEGYGFTITPHYLLVYVKQTHVSSQSKLCHLTISLKKKNSDALSKLKICLDFSRFSSLITSRLSLPFDTHSFKQNMLTQLTPPLPTPIVIVESVFCLDCHQFLVPQADGSFVDKQEVVTQAEVRSLLYSICDGIEHVATGIAVATRATKLQKRSNMQQTKIEH
jgi:hypothetical protein